VAIWSSQKDGCYRQVLDINDKFDLILQMGLIQRFFDHVLEVKPHIFVTYNGDMFDW